METLNAILDASVTVLGLIVVLADLAVLSYMGYRMATTRSPKPRLPSCGINPRAHTSYASDAQGNGWINGRMVAVKR